MKGISVKGVKQDENSHICHEVFQNLPIIKRKIACWKRKNAQIIGEKNKYLKNILKNQGVSFHLPRDIYRKDTILKMNY